MLASTKGGHSDFVMSNARDIDHAAIEPIIARSWHRSLDVHRLDPQRAVAPRVLTGGSLREHQDPMESLMQIAKGGMESLFLQVREAGYIVLLTDHHGVAVDFQTNPMSQQDLRRAGLYLGSCWSESDEGTCAVGTCIVDNSAITVHQGEHFRTSNTKLTCSAAPILDTDGKLLAVLDASALHSSDDKRSQALVLQLVSTTAKMIENVHFLEKFDDFWIIRLSRRREFAEVVTDGLIALDQQGRVLALNRNAQDELKGSEYTLRGKLIEEIFDVRLDALMSASMERQRQTLAVRALHNSRQYYAVMRSPCARLVLPAAPAGRSAIARTPSLKTVLTLADLAGADPQMLKNVKVIQRVINKGIAIMLQGETGTGKEAFATAIHHASDRAGKPFVALNCAAIPESLIESELFGYASGAFTGARAAGMRGKIVQAHGGTLFLDEIGDMPLQLQTRLLRVLAEKEILPLGSEKPIPVDVQIVCATHRNLLDLVVDGRFREDLYYRLNGMKLNLLAVRHRADKSQLVHCLLAMAAQEAGRDGMTIDASALAALLAYPWPGNLRQLNNVLKAAMALNDDHRITFDDLPSEIESPARDNLVQSTHYIEHPSALNTMPLGGGSRSDAEAVAVAVDNDDDDDDECTQLMATLKKKKWNITLVAQSLGVCRATVYRKMTKFQIVEPNNRE